ERGSTPSRGAYARRLLSSSDADGVLMAFTPDSEPVVVGGVGELFQVVLECALIGQLPVGFASDLDGVVAVSLHGDLAMPLRAVDLEQGVELRLDAGAPEAGREPRPELTDVNADVRRICRGAGGVHHT